LLWTPNSNEIPQILAFFAKKSLKAFPKELWLVFVEVENMLLTPMALLVNDEALQI
jgi:hypothetical protein